MWMVTALLLVLWLLGMLSGYTLGAWIHLLLVLALVSVVITLIRRGPDESVV